MPRNIDTTAACNRNRELKNIRIEEYAKNPKKCEQCALDLPFHSDKRKRFCNQSCAATYNNKQICRNGVKRCDCLNCGKSLTNKNSKKYCNADCRKSFQESSFIASWKNGIVTCGEKLTERYRNYLLLQANNKCSQCGWGDINSTSGRVALTIDHIDGNPNNHLLSNLRVLCPNCHSLTSTYGGLNKGNGRKKRYVKI